MVLPVFRAGFSSKSAVSRPGYPHPSPHNDRIVFRRLSFNLKVLDATADPWRKTGDLECSDTSHDRLVHEAHS
jgi:hypothetical protein